MGMVTRAQTKRRRRLQEEEEHAIDRISRLPDGVLGDIVSLLPTRDGARTQVLSSRWRHLWRSAPLNLELETQSRRPIPVPDADAAISRLLSAHPGPCRRFCVHMFSVELSDQSAAAFDGWLRSPALDGLQELGFHGFPSWGNPPLPLPASARRFSSTLRFASFGGFSFPEGDGATARALLFPVLKQLTLRHVTVSESSLHSLLAGCPVLQSLLLVLNNGFSRLRIVSSSLRSIGVRPGSRDKMFQQLIINDAPSLEKLLLFGAGIGMPLDISVISAPKLAVLGKIFDGFPTLQFDTTVFQGSNLVSMATVVQSVKVLALTNMYLDLDVVINFLECFPCLEILYIKGAMAGGQNESCDNNQNLFDTLDIGLKKIVLKNYRGDKSHVNFVRFFVLNARVLQSMVLEIEGTNISHEWIEKQHELLQTKKRASRGARFDFVCHDKQPEPLGPEDYEQAHELSIVDPFVRFRDWSRF